MFALLLAETNYVGIYIPSMVFGAIVGALIGNSKGRWITGLLLGAFLGCIGWIITLLLPRKERF